MACNENSAECWENFLKYSWCCSLFFPSHGFSIFPVLVNQALTRPPPTLSCLRSLVHCYRQLRPMHRLWHRVTFPNFLCLKHPKPRLFGSHPPGQKDNCLPPWDVPLLHHSEVPTVFINRARQEMETDYTLRKCSSPNENPRHFHCMY